MPYFLSNACTYKEVFNPEHVYIFTGKCVISKQEVTVKVRGEDLYDYNHGAFIQDAFPYLSADEREFMMTGMFEFPDFEE